MTRINADIHPRELPDKLLLAEHREITRIPNAVTSGRAVLVTSLAQFTLGTGHVRFFYYRLGYLRRRYHALLVECRHRGFNVTDKSDAFARVPPAHLQDYKPSARDRQIVLDRIASKGFTLLEGTEGVLDL